MGSDSIHPGVLKELTGVITGLPSTIYQGAWESGMNPADWKLANVILMYKKCMRKDQRNYRRNSLSSVPGKLMEVILNATERQLKKKAIRHSQHRFMKEKFYFNNLESFYDKVTHLLDEGKAVDVIFLHFSKAFGTVPHCILLDNL